MPILSRRSFFVGLGAAVAAPAIVRVASIMPVRALVPAPVDYADLYRRGLLMIVHPNMFADLVAYGHQVAGPVSYVVTSQLLPTSMAARGPSAWRSGLARPARA